ncbi:acetylornithine deacetylase [Primorskyibacter flagellatus]|uniref:Acetylornithine deacetylase n=1 Tax=Primorskyibacter flagellatus TaxID=1387277 RepID=A0A1W2EAE8_9RHOB|nr:acetylornithine deacetylase [Primorskyibacter flagellatus]SMD06018.1 acetylornithine deacetylase [Primorskyibacter flagellatus]
MNTESHHARTLEILERLIAFPTVSATSNLALIDYVESLLVEAGFETLRIPDPELPKSGLVARIGGDGPGGLLLSAHSDVVPVEGQAWTRPPFELTREEDRFYGRGTTDMKGYLAAMLSMAERAGKTPPERPLMLAISYDEEVGCQGIRKMLPGIERLGWCPDLCIVGEPTSMHPAIGHKGKAAFRAICRGTAGHSALAPRFVNALHLAGEVIAVLRRLQDDFVKSNVRDAAYDIPYSTVHAGRMQGGAALNIVPDRAEIEFELRHLAADNFEDFQRALRREVDLLAEGWHQRDPAASIEIALTNSYPGLNVAPDDPAVNQVATLCGSDTRVKVAFGTEAGFFAHLGIPTIVCGPGNMEGQGHKADEYLEAGQLAACDRMMDRALSGLA